MFVESVKNGKVVLRGAFSDDDYLTARCCDMAVFPKEGLIVVDLNITRRRSLFEFMKYVMKSFVESPMYASKRKEVFGLIAMEYRAIEDRFFTDNQRFLPKHVEGHTMLEHQKKDIVNLVKHKHNLLAWEQGLGKTIEAATASVITQSKNTCVIAPAFVKWGWFKDLATDWGFDQTKFSIFDAARSRSLTAFLQERFVIVNYEMVDRYKNELSKRKFDHIVIDECFPYDTVVKTEAGDMLIGDIVSGNLPVRVYCFNFVTNSVELKPIVRWLENPIRDKYFIKINLSNGESVTCTNNHKVWVEGIGYQHASEVKAGAFVKNISMPMLQHDVRDLSENSKILQSKMSSRRVSKIKVKGCFVSGVWSCISSFFIENKKILQHKLFGKVEDEHSGSKRAAAGSWKGKQGENLEVGKNLGKNEKKQSDVDAGSKGKNDSIQQGENIFIKGWKWTANKATSFTFRSPWKSSNGVSSKTDKCEAAFQLGAEMLQGGHCNSREENSNRGGRRNPQNKEVEIFGQEKNGNIKLLRVESCEILEQGSGSEFATLCPNGFVYDIEVDGNHNYFANGVLVSNCHKIKNVKSQRYKAIRNLVAKHPDAKITLASGTPIGNRADDLFAYLRLVNHPLGENERYYKERYLEFGARGKVVGTRNADELRVRTSNFILRRTQDECLDLPEKIIGRYYFKLDEYRDEYDRILDEIADKQEERMRFLEDNRDVIEMYEALKMKSRETGDKNDTSALRLYYQTHVDILSRYNQSENLGGGSSLHSLNRLVSMAKIEGVSELIDQVIENGDKIAVFGSYYGPLEELQNKYGDKAILITGKVDSGKRHELLQRFVNDPECKIYLANMEAGGVGINGVQKVCSDVVFLNFPFVPKDIEQALARVVRQGQKRSVRVYYTICEDSIDEDLYDLVANKAHDNHEILDKGNKRVMDYRNIERKLFNSLLKKKNHVS